MEMPPNGPLSATCQHPPGRTTCSPVVIAVQRDGQQNQGCQLDGGDGGD
jgi:hypothetical protein